ncbi:type II toxin-antitoxin system RelE/ParE family toxin [Blastopirellula sp. J2-11]|uniref:type II toxin-antitoxin system RelE/ParE family toxin n=1 Tax=Blastopirellula sp. J2-11 TaxID=2943192 RepID=UPI0021C5A45F|nr:type II toxin-antitoxin system RelE/ParE family toxin [Blastopirellula sp. J2-11]UUO06689.1 type II toxin-antitoxin system RelE/ParE family toxin [Blastopirellula sp. J2-11]
MARYRISVIAEQDIEAILRWTQEQFGEQGRLRYEALLIEAILDIADDPERTGVRLRPELWPGAFSYHLYFSRNHIASTIERIRRPRHFLLCRYAETGDLEIARVLHDSMDLDRHLPWDGE